MFRTRLSRYGCWSTQSLSCSTSHQLHEYTEWHRNGTANNQILWKFTIRHFKVTVATTVSSSLVRTDSILIIKSYGLSPPPAAFQSTFFGKALSHCVLDATDEAWQTNALHLLSHIAREVSKNMSRSVLFPTRLLNAAYYAHAKDLRK